MKAPLIEQTGGGVRIIALRIIKKLDKTRNLC